MALVGIAVLMPGMYLSNRLLVETALQEPTLIGYAVSGCAALAAALLLRSKIRSIVQSVPARRLVLVVAATGGGTAAVLDAVFLTQAHHYENTDVASQQPAIVDELGRRLAGYLKASWPGFTDAIAAGE